MPSLPSNPVVAVALLALIGLAIFFGLRLISHLSDTRAQLVREERVREDKARKDDAGDPTLNTLGDVFDFLHLFH